MNLLLFLLLNIALELSTAQTIASNYPIDSLEPIVRLSPASRNGGDPDRFGYSAVAVQLQRPSEQDSYLTALRNTVIMVGAPNGKFPGGIVGIELSSSACEDISSPTLDEINNCYGNLTTGLVYSCPLTSGECGATLGNGNATDPEGLLFDRVGNVKKLDVVAKKQLFQDKDGQLMGSMMYSTDDYFVVCAPLWKFTGYIEGSESEPLGQCVYANKNLTKFAVAQPCRPASSNNQNLEAFCLLGSSVHISSNDSNPILAAGSPSRQFSSGGVYYFNDLDNFDNLMEGGEKSVYVPASHANAPSVRTGYKNVDDSTGRQTYYGFAVASGYITRADYKDFIVSAPRWNQDNQLGRVSIVTELNAIPSIHIEGEQFGDYFGNSIAIADLNGDGWDDIIVGAPMYSQSSMPELGQIFIYENIEGVSFSKSVVIEGLVSFGRFGYSMVAIGDINDDGYDDFAVSAPYEGSGVVYVFYGQERDSDGSIADPQYAQRIDGASFIDRVSNITDVRMFGFSLSSNIDVDNNQYQDLIVGAHESQVVFLLRSRPFANINISMTLTSGPVSLATYSCTNDLNHASSCFSIMVCASYTGKSLEEGFSANYTISEGTTDSQRLYFGGASDSSVTRPLYLPAPDTPTCDNVTIYILNSTVSLDFKNFELVAEMEQISRPLVTVDTNHAPSDFSKIPQIVSEPEIITVPVDSQCGEDDICDLDLQLAHINTTFLGLDGTQYQEQSYLTLDAVTRVDIYLSYSNFGEDVFGYFISFPLQRNLFIHRLVLPQSSFFTCNDTTPNNDTHANLICNDQKPFLRSSNNQINIHLRWVVNTALRGAINTITVPITILSDPSDSRNREINPANNQVLVKIDIRSRASFTTILQFGQSHVTYQGNRTAPTVEQDDASNLGEELRLAVTINNEGPSTIHNAALTLYIPARTTRDNDNNYYFYYPAAMQITSGSIMCAAAGILNPEEFSNTTLSSSRRRRSLVGGVRGGVWSALTRQLRQAESNSSYDLDCLRNPNDCLALKCDITNIVGSAALTIIGFIDERFYNGKSSQYSLNAYANVTVDNSFVNTTGSRDSATDTLSLSKVSPPEDPPGIPWYYIAPPAVGAFILILVLVLLLYCFGFFRRKKHNSDDDDEDDRGVEQFLDNPFGDGKKPVD